MRTGLSGGSGGSAGEAGRGGVDSSLPMASSADGVRRRALGDKILTKKKEVPDEKLSRILPVDERLFR